MGVEVTFLPPGGNEGKIFPAYISGGFLEVAKLFIICESLVMLKPSPASFESFLRGFELPGNSIPSHSNLRKRFGKWLKITPQLPGLKKSDLSSKLDKFRFRHFNR